MRLSMRRPSSRTRVLASEGCGFESSYRPNFFEVLDAYPFLYMNLKAPSLQTSWQEENFLETNLLYKKNS